MKRFMSFSLVLALIFSSLQMLAVCSSAGSRSWDYYLNYNTTLDIRIDVTSDKLLQREKNVTTDKLIEKLTKYNWVVSSGRAWGELFEDRYRIVNGKIQRTLTYSDGTTRSYTTAFSKKNGGAISFGDYTILDVGFDNALIIQNDWCVEFIFKDEIGSADPYKYRDYMNYRFVSPYLSENGADYIKFTDKEINVYPIKNNRNYGFWYETYEPMSGIKNCCRDGDYTDGDPSFFFLINQGEDYYAFYPFESNGLYYVLEEWTKMSDDDPNAWYAESVKYVTDKGFMKGYADGRFGANDGLKRQDFVCIIARIAGANLKNYENMTSKLKDVQKGAYYAASVNWAVENGVISGYQNGNFGVNDPITREQVATILYNYMNKPEVKDANKILAKFPDASKVSSFAKIPVAWAVSNGVISGMGNGTVASTSGATRAQIAAIIQRMDTQGMFNK